MSLVLLVVILVATMLLPIAPVVASEDDFTPPTQDAYGCSRASSYSTYHNGKPAVYVYSPGVDRSIVAFYYGSNGWEYVPNAAYGIEQNTPQNRDGDWEVFYISTRWRYSNYYRMLWDTDWRWYILFC